VETQGLQTTVAIPVIILSILVKIAGIYAIKRTGWRLALAGSICGALFTWFLGLPAIILAVQ